MNRDDLEAIKAMTGAKEVSCHCNQCIAMCKATPCLGTPQEILNIANNGFGQYLSPVDWRAGKIAGIPEIKMVQIMYDEEKGQCSLLDDNNKCRLHDLDLKPSEGVLATHSMDEYKKHFMPTSFAVALSWTAEWNIKTMILTFKLMLKQNGDI